MKSLIHWLENHIVPCIFKKYFDIECPGCGMQRSFIELLKGNLSESIKIYPPLIPMIIMVLLLILHLIFKLKNGAKVLKISFIFVALIIIINYILKLIIH
jgi:hypothetical protein